MRTLRTYHRDVEVIQRRTVQVCLRGTRSSSLSKSQGAPPSKTDSDRRSALQVSYPADFQLAQSQVENMDYYRTGVSPVKTGASQRRPQ